MSAEIVSHDPTNANEEHDDLENGNGTESRGIKRQRVSNPADDDDDDDDKPGRERRKIEIKFIQDKSRRHITFSKRKAGIMKKVRTRLRDNNIATRSLHDACMLTWSRSRPTSCQSLPALKYSSSLSRKLV